MSDLSQGRRPSAAKKYSEAPSQLHQHTTEPIQAEAVLRETEEREEQMHLLLDSIAEGIFGIDGGAHCTFCNPAALRILGYQSPEQLLGKDMHALIHHTRADGSPYPPQECPILKALQNGQGAHIQDEVLWKADGTSFHAEYWSNPQRKGNQIVGAVVAFIDITPRQRARRELEQSEEKFAKAFREAPMALTLTSTIDHRYIDVNATFERLTGYSREEIIGRTPFDLGVWVNPSERYDLVRQVLKEGGVRGIERQFRMRDGSIHIGLANVQPIEIDGEQLILSAILDITDRRRALQQLQESEQKFRTIFRDAPTGMAMVSLEGNFLGANKAFCDFIGYREDELIGKNYTSIMDRRDRAASAQPLKDIANQRESRKHLETRYVHKDGQLRWGSVKSSLISDSEGKPQYIVTHLTDITERKQAQQKVTETEEKFRTIFRDAPSAMALVAPDGRYLLVNKALCEFLGYSEEELLATDIVSVTHPDDRPGTIKRLNTLRERLDPERVEKRYLHKNGGVRWGDLSKSLIRDDDGNPLFIVSQIVDITGRKRMEQELRHHEWELSEAQRVAQVGSWTHDRDTDVLTWSDEMYRIHGRDPRLGPPTFEEMRSSFTPESWNRLVATREKAWRTGSVPSEDLELVRPDGSHRWIATRGEVERDAAGRPVRLRGTAQDITERKLAEQKLREYEKAIEEAEEMIAVVDRDYRYVIANPAFVNRRKLTREQVVGRLASEVLDKEIFETSIKNQIDQSFQGKVVRYELKYVYPELGKRDLFISCFPIEGPTGIERVACILQDVTDRKRMENELRQRESELKQAQRIAQVGSWTWDPTTDAVRWSDELIALFGWNPKLPLPTWRDHEQFFDADSYHRLNEAIQETLATGEPYEVDTETVLHDGRKAWFTNRGEVVRNPHGEIDHLRGTVQDITHRKLAEYAIGQSEERYRSLVESSHDWIWEVDADAKYTYVSDQCRQVLGYEPKELFGKKPFDLMPVAEAQRVAELFGTIAKERKPFRALENINLHKDGHAVVLETNGTPIVDEHGRLIGYRGMDRDITERKRSEQALRESEERFRRVVEHISDALVVDDVKGRVVFANNRFLNLFGFSREELPTVRIEDYTAPEYCAEARNRHDRRMSGEDVPTHFEYEGCRRDGSRMWLEVDVVPIRDENGGLCGTQSAVRDITLRKQTEIALRESEERFRNIANSAPVMIWMSTVDQGCAYVNKSWLDFTGRPLETQLGFGWLDSIHPEDVARRQEVFIRASEHRDPFETDYRLRRHDGEYRYIVETAMPRFNADGSFAGYIGSCIDDTERRRGEQATRSVSGKLIEAQERERKRIARELHDDINQRLALIALQLEQLQSKPRLPAAYKEQIRKVFNETTGVSSGIQALSHELHSASLDILGLVPAIRGFCNELCKRQKVKVDFTSDGVPSTLSDEVALALFRVTQEALHNAVKYSGVRHFQVRLQGASNQLELTVRDSGVGFGLEAAMGGRGLGLISMRERIAPLKGTISIISRPQRGTEITVRVPVPEPH